MAKFTSASKLYIFNELIKITLTLENIVHESVLVLNSSLMLLLGEVH